jgi:hypothetical protein
MCGFDNRIKNLGWNCVTLITAAAAMSLQQADGFIHGASSILLAPLAVSLLDSLSNESY